MADNEERVFKFGEEDEGMEKHHHEFKPKPYMNPYLAGIGVGLSLLAIYVFLGRGLGASGGVSVFVASIVDFFSHSTAQGNDFFAKYLGEGAVSPFKHWAFFLVLGALAGGFISGTLANRVKLTIEKGPRISNAARLALAFVGGSLMGFGAKLARGCTSGQGLTGGAILNLGSWAVMLSIFAAAYALAYFLRRQWR